MTSATTTHELKGIEADNLLGFLALLGLLRALHAERPNWDARISWNTAPLSARLHIFVPASKVDVATAADAGASRLGTPVAFDRGDIKFSTNEFRATGTAALTQPLLAVVFAALGSDGALKRDGTEIEPTPLCLMFGQGHQHFLARLQSYSREDAGGAESIRGALFEPWRYEDKLEGFRWDPIEDRRYAYQSGDPSDQKNKLGTVAGANRLAAIGFAALTCAPRTSGLAAVGVRGARKQREICWPLPGVPTSLAGYLALLAHPALIDTDDCVQLGPLGVVAVARARRIQAGKFFNVERAQLIILD